VSLTELPRHEETEVIAMKPQPVLVLILLLATACAARAAEPPRPMDFPPELYAGDESAAHKTTLTVVTANVGNADLFRCGNPYLYKLCVISVEQRVAAALASVRPDIVALQEVFDDDRCADIKEKDKGKVCYGYETREPRHQARRLLGPDYTIVCDNRSHFECIGVHKDAGAIPGCEPGGLCRGTAMIAAPAPAVCDAHPAIFAVDAEIRGLPVRIVNAHPSASNRQCRTEQLQGLFQGYQGAPPVADPKRNMLIMGDLNLHPFSDFTDSSIEIWRAYAGEGKDYYYLSGPAEHDPPFPTNAGRTIDHVISNFAMGKCLTLGRAPQTPRFDGTHGDTDPAGTDHSPIVCELRFPGK
jgi:hypothetical protein